MESGHDPDARLPELCDFRDRVFGVLWSGPVLRRLSWSFFRDREPNYAGDAMATVQAMARFLDWAMFFARPAGEGTLASYALADMTKETTPQQTEFWTRFSKPDYVVGDVTEVIPRKGYVLHDRISGKDYRINDPAGSESVERGNGIIGPLFAVSDHEFGYEVNSLFGKLFDATTAPISPSTGEELGPRIEEQVYGANTDWIAQMSSLDDIGRAYDEFQADIGNPLPPWHVLKRMLSSAETIDDLVNPVVSSTKWWTKEEINVALAFMTRIWHLHEAANGQP
jgi:hypothetical protein